MSEIDFSGFFELIPVENKIVRTFDINEVEDNRIKEFQEQHKDCVYNRAVKKFFDGDSTDLRKLQEIYPDGPRYVFHPTGIGTGVMYVCGCGEKINATDYDCW